MKEENKKHFTKKDVLTGKFNPEEHPEFMVLDKNWPDLIPIDHNDTLETKNKKILHNSINRDVYQRNHLMTEISKLDNVIPSQTIDPHNYFDLKGNTLRTYGML